MPEPSSAYVEDYARNGYAIVRGLFPADEIAAIGAAIDQVHAEGVAHGRSFRHGNLFYNVDPNGDGPPQVRMVQWMSRHQPVLNGVRLDRRIARVLEPLIGRDLKQIINQLHWKTPGRRGDFVPRSHEHGPLELDTSTTVLGTAMDDAALVDVGLSPDSVVDLVLEPGDLAMWNPYLVHASGLNRSGHYRRLYINGYVRAEDCDRGEWAFRDGEPVPFGPEPALVHYEALRERGEPHYV